DKKKNGQIIQLAKEQAKVWLRTKTAFVFNATNITKDMRSKWISLFTDYGASVKIIYLEVPYQRLLSQNHNRAFKVPQPVIEQMIRKLEIPSYREAQEVVYICADD
ncbi:MAG: AAA family ATPase, partial [Bacteroidota bacterium]